MRSAVNLFSADTKGPLDIEDRKRITEIVSLLANYNIVHGLAALRELVYNTLSARYANNLKVTSSKLDDKDIDVLEGLLNIVY